MIFIIFCTYWKTVYRIRQQIQKFHEFANQSDCFDENNNKKYANKTRFDWFSSFQKEIKVNSFLKLCLHYLLWHKKWYLHQTFQLMSAVVRLKVLVKVPLLCVKQRLCKYCFKNEWTLGIICWIRLVTYILYKYLCGTRMEYHLKFLEIV